MTDCLFLVALGLEDGALDLFLAFAVFRGSKD